MSERSEAPVMGWRYERFVGGWHVHTFRDRRGDRGHVTFLPAIRGSSAVYEVAVVTARDGCIEFTQRIGDRHTLRAAKHLLERTLARGARP